MPLPRNPVPYWIVHVWPGGHLKGEPTDISGLISSLTYEDSEEKADKLAFDVENFDLSHFDNPVLQDGFQVTCQFGYPGNVSPERICTIKGIKGFRKLKIEALDKSATMHKDELSRTWEKMTRSQVVRELAKHAGYDDDRIFVEDTPVVYDTIAQTKLTDASFLKLLAQKEGFEFYTDWDGFHWHPKRLGQKPVRKYTYYFGEGDLLDVDTDTDVTAKPAKVVAAGKDPKTKEDISESGSNADTDRDGLASEVTEPVETAVDPFGEKTNVRQYKDVYVAGPVGPNPDDPGGAPKVVAGEKAVALTTEPTAEGAKRQADGAYNRAAMKKVKLKLKMVGDPTLVGKTVIELEFPNAKSISGKYYVETVSHSLAKSGGYTMDVTVKRDGGNGKKGGAKNPSDAKKNEKEADADGGEGLQTLVNPYGEKSDIGGKDIVWQDTRGREN